MSNEEAIKICEELWRYEHSDRFSTDDIREALTIALNALEKQIPKNPIRTSNKSFPFSCPTCGCMYIDDVYYYNCITCGQKLSWSDNDE